METNYAIRGTFDAQIAAFLSAASTGKVESFLVSHLNPKNDKEQNVCRAAKNWLEGNHQEALQQLDPYLGTDNNAAHTLAGLIGISMNSNDEYRYEQALQRIERAAIAKYAPAELAWARLLLENNCPRAARWWFEQAAHNGSTRAEVWLTVLTKSEQ